MPVTVTVKTKTGSVMDVQFESVVAIDGKPYQDDVDPGDTRDAIINLDARMTQLEAFVATFAGSSKGPDKI